MNEELPGYVTPAPANTFWVQANGDDAPIILTTADYEEAHSFARENSFRWLGTKVSSRRSGKTATYKDGAETGYLDATKGWVKR